MGLLRLGRAGKGSWRGWLVVSLLLTACASVEPVETDVSSARTLWPAPPEQPRIRWEAVFHHANDVEIKTQEQRQSFKEAIAADKFEADKKVFSKPVRVASYEGRIFVTDTMVRAVHVFDAPRRRYFRFGYRREGTLGKPLGITVDDNGLIYVVDAGQNKRVVVYDQLGMWVRSIGEKEGLEYPTGVAVSPSGDRIYLTENGRVKSDKHQLLIFDAEGTLLKRIGTRGSEPGQMNYPTDVAVGPDGRVFLLDAANFRIQVLDRDGTFLSQWGKLGRGLGQFARPRSLAVDQEGLVYVLDGSFANFQIFDDKGNLLLAVGERGKEDGPGIYASPSGIAVDKKGFIYVVDQWLHKVEVLRKLNEEEGKRTLAEAMDKTSRNLKKN